MLNPWLGITLVLAAFVGVMGMLRLYTVHYHPHPEVPRKMLHVGMGLVACAFPWIFAETWPAWVVAAAAVTVLLASRVPNPLQQRLGGVVDGVSRDSLGDLYFPVSVALIFTLADRNIFFFCIPILVLALADAVAALIGIFYGHIHYQTAQGYKSAEGSIAFFMVAFFSTHVPLLLFTNTGRVETLLIAATIGLLVMLIEAIAWQGLDNLLIPLSCYLLLVGYLPMDATRLTELLVATILWVTFVFVLRHRTTLNDGALFGAALVGYLTWSLGGWLWVLPPLILFICYPIIWRNQTHIQQRPHDIRAVMAISLPGLLLLSIARYSGHWELLMPYAVGYAAQLAFVGIAYVQDVSQRHATFREIVVTAAIGWVILVIPFTFFTIPANHRVIAAALALIILLASVTTFSRIIPLPKHRAEERIPWLPQAILGILTPLFYILFINFCNG